MSKERIDGESTLSRWWRAGRNLTLPGEREALLQQQRATVKEHIRRMIEDGEPEEGDDKEGLLHLREEE